MDDAPLSVETVPPDLKALAQSDFAPALTWEEMEEAEAAYEERWGVARRLSLATLIRSKTELVSGFGNLVDVKSESDAAATLMEIIEKLRDWAGVP